MTLHAAFAFYVAVYLLGLTPGPGVFAVIARGLAQGFVRTLPFIAGILCGNITWLTLTVFGLSMVAQVLGPLFLAVKIAGGLYLVYMGVKMWRKRVTAEDLDADVPEEASLLRRWLSGYMLTLGNPKPIFFYLSVLPNLLDMNALAHGAVLTAAPIAAAGIASALIPYCLMASRLRRVLRSVTARRRLNRTAGAMLMGAGAAVVAN
ncbi:LysE family translocator [Caenispirillum bisanense]|uniref:Threonine/homoserine/homoserine lactone efflux protein n=1 Tax=Caenispirillum bisanense TaxID=414052 RepID=A0A286G5T6_9PROT|nr:LysE family translocator [Caenispirillum bisanense]SOD90344.1 Threonine/homoserine/homoserine lactone efflux protein [Caenispirillum bisanense]